MRKSLRHKLNDYIRVNGTVSYAVVKDLVETGYFGKRYRMSTAERRLRKSESPDVTEEMENGHITKYRWVGVKPEFRTFKVEGMEKVIKLQV